MSDYISRQAAIDKLKSEPIGRMIISKYNLDGWLEGLPSADVVGADKAQKEIDYWHDKAQSYEQTILRLTLNKADVVEVVRCKDCKHKIFDKSRNLYYCNMYYGIGSVRDNNYCSFGERA